VLAKEILEGESAMATDGCFPPLSAGVAGDGGVLCRVVWAEFVPDILRIGIRRYSFGGMTFDPPSAGKPAPGTGGFAAALACFSELPFPECDAARLNNPVKLRLTDGLSCAVALRWSGVLAEAVVIFSVSVGNGGRVAAGIGVRGWADADIDEWLWTALTARLAAEVSWDIPFCGWWSSLAVGGSSTLSVLVSSSSASSGMDICKFTGRNSGDE